MFDGLLPFRLTRIYNIRAQESQHTPGQKQSEGHWVLSAFPDEIFAGRLAEAEAKTLKGAERQYSAPADRERRRQRRSAGAQENRDGMADRTQCPSDYFCPGVCCDS